MSVLKARLLGVAVVVSLGTAARLPSDSIEPQELAARFSFASTTLDHRFGMPVKQTRDVHPELRRIGPWIASVGAAAAAVTRGGGDQHDRRARTQRPGAVDHEQTVERPAVASLVGQGLHSGQGQRRIVRELELEHRRFARFGTDLADEAGDAACLGVSSGESRQFGGGIDRSIEQTDVR